MSPYNYQPKATASFVPYGAKNPNNPPKRGHTLLSNCPDIAYISKFKTLSYAACLLEPHAASLSFSHLYLCNPEVMPWIYIPVRGEPSRASNDWLLHLYSAVYRQNGINCLPAPGSDPTCSADFFPQSGKPSPGADCSRRGISSCHSGGCKSVRSYSELLWPVPGRMGSDHGTAPAGEGAQGAWLRKAQRWHWGSSLASVSPHRELLF